MIRLTLRLVPALLALALAGGATAQSTTSTRPTPSPPITVDQLLAHDVTVAAGGSLTDDERTRLEQAATELATPDSNGESFPTRFVIVPAPVVAADLNAQAATLRQTGIERLGNADGLDAVILLAPRAIGISANAFASEIADAITAERATLRQDRVAGTIAVARRLQALDAANVLPGEQPSTDSGSSSRAPVLWISTILILLIIAGGIVFNRRTVAARKQRQWQAELDRERAADDGAPPPDMRQ